MRLITSSLALFLSIALANASSVHNPGSLAARHARLSRSASQLEVRADTTAKRCPNRKGPKSATATVTPAANNAAAKAVSTTKASAKASASPAAAPAAAPVNVNGLIKVTSNQCGASRATSQITTVSGPNGHMDWMNCGFEGGGWTPPNVKIKDLITQPLTTALQKGSSPFNACSKYIYLFEQYGNQYGIPPIMMASFAMQESGCNPNTVGGGGEQGVMQITKEKCAGAPGGDCKNPDFNIHTATKFFAATLAANGGNVFLAVGQYNGWYAGLTKAKAFAARYSSCCRCQNNGDYIHQYFNGWIQNVNAYGPLKLGKYFNLDDC